MVVQCTKCGNRFEAKAQLQLHTPPICARCQKQDGQPFRERVNFDDRPEDARLKERELRECS